VVSVNYHGDILKLEGEKVLVAVGRRSSAATLNLEAAGIKNERGVIAVNDKMETSVPGVYALETASAGPCCPMWPWSWARSPR
jgi:dihydrolipoamide dehydrogenase